MGICGCDGDGRHGQLQKQTKEWYRSACMSMICVRMIRKWIMEDNIIVKFDNLNFYRFLTVSLVILGFLLTGFQLNYDNIMKIREDELSSKNISWLIIYYLHLDLHTEDLRVKDMTCRNFVNNIFTPGVYISNKSVKIFDFNYCWKSSPDT